MKTIKKADFANHIHKKFGLPSATSERIVDIIFGEITDSLKRGEEVKITNFGTFSINHKSERMGRNPKTGKPAVISARRVPTFHTSAEFREKMRKSG
jgi:integration host factor subunit alpha